MANEVPHQWRYLIFGCLRGTIAPNVTPGERRRDTEIMPLAEIGTLWIGKELSWLEQLCLASFVDHGHRVNLFTYGDVGNVPEGVNIESANSFLSGDDILLHTKTGSPAYHADVFRLRMIKDSDLVWADTDAFCCQPWDIPIDSHFHGWISDDKPSVNNGVLGLPKNSRTLARMLEFTSDEYPIPPWFSDDKRADLEMRKANGNGVHVSDLPWGVWGPNALTWFLRETGEIEFSKPGHVLYPVPFSLAGVVLNPARRNKANQLIKPETLSIHFWGRRFRNIAARYNGIPARNTLVDALLTRHAIDPRPTAHLFVAKSQDEDGSNAGKVDPDLAWVSEICDRLQDQTIGSIADINGSSAPLSAALHKKFEADVVFVGLNSKGEFRSVPENERSAYCTTLEQLGVPRNHVTFVEKEVDCRTFDVIATLDGFGATHKIGNFAPFLKMATRTNSHVILDIKKGSGAYPFLKQFGTCWTLNWRLGKSDTTRTVTQCDLPDDDQTWGSIAEGIQGEDGFFRDLGRHSFLHVRRGNTLVVTFDNLDIVMTKREDRRPWGYDFIEKNGWSMLGVMAAGWTWFRDSKVIAEFEALRDDGFFEAFDRVVFYGASMGGYAACVFSAIVGGATVVAISPQSTLDKAVVPWETRYKKAWDADFSGPYGDAARTIRTVELAHILYDPYQALDVGHAERIIGKNVVHWRCPLLGHRLGSSLNQMGVLGGIVRSAIDGTLTPAMFHTALRARKTFPRYQRELLAMAISRGKTNLARRICTYALEQRDDRYFRRQLRALEAD